MPTLSSVATTTAPRVASAGNAAPPAARGAPAFEHILANQAGASANGHSSTPQHAANLPAQSKPTTPETSDTPDSGASAAASNAQQRAARAADPHKDGDASDDDDAARDSTGAAALAAALLGTPALTSVTPVPPVTPTTPVTGDTAAISGLAGGASAALTANNDAADVAAHGATQWRDGQRADGIDPRGLAAVIQDDGTDAGAATALGGPNAVHPNAAEQAAAALVSAANGPTVPSVAMPLALPVAPALDHPDWGDAFGQQIVWLSNAHQQVAELHLNPPDLGPLHVVLHVADAQAQALFVSPHAAVREAMQAALPQLRDALANTGVALGQTAVGADSAAGQQAFGQGNASGQSARGAIGGVRRGGAMAALPATLASQPQARSGLVDDFA